MIGTDVNYIFVATLLALNNYAIRRSYNRAIEWDDYGDADDQLRDRLALFRPCILSVAVPAHGADRVGEIHHGIHVMLPVKNDGYVTAYLDVSDTDYRTAIMSDIPRMLELNLPPFATDPMEFGVSRAKAKMLPECFAQLDDYDTLGDERE